MSVPFLVAQQMDSSSKVKEVSLVLTKILIPLCCHKNHWCRIVVDAQLKDACVYDLMFSSYNVSVHRLKRSCNEAADYAPRKYASTTTKAISAFKSTVITAGLYVLL
ncbi:Ulp1 protease family, C-terminal catalytic domain [Phytophthora cactorum]|nr:Ulp1 protease family, C-terminal catalytic domain [Phytophthora cactorum]